MRILSIHKSKGLEFPVVLLCGLARRLNREDMSRPILFHPKLGVGPKRLDVERGMEYPTLARRAVARKLELEMMAEELRLLYVAMTRAKEKLYMTCASQRMLFGRTNSNRPSRFLGEIPPEYVEKSGRLPYAERAEREAERPARRAPVRRTFDRGFSMGSAAAPASAGAPAPDWKSPAAGRAPAGGALPGFRMGDSVQHKAFGRGLITKVTPMGGDALVEIAFDSVGTKKLMLKSASQYMKKV